MFINLRWLGFLFLAFFVLLVSSGCMEKDKYTDRNSCVFGSVPCPPRTAPTPAPPIIEISEETMQGIGLFVGNATIVCGGGFAVLALLGLVLALLSSNQSSGSYSGVASRKSSGYRPKGRALQIYGSSSGSDPKKVKKYKRVWDPTLGHAGAYVDVPDDE